MRVRLDPYTAGLPLCTHCRRQQTRYPCGLTPCACASGLCDDCCCGWDERCPDCGSGDHEQYDTACSDRDLPVRDRALNEYLARCAAKTTEHRHDDVEAHARPS